MSRQRPRGFTLIELLVVVAIIGILSTIVFVALSSSRAKGRDAQRIAQVRQIATALEFFAPPGGTYPSTGGAWYNSITQGAGWIPATDPGLRRLAVSDPLNAATNEYEYFYISNGTNYCVQLSQERDCSSSPYYAGVSAGSCKLRLGSTPSYCTSAPATSGGGGGPPPASPSF